MNNLFRLDDKKAVITGGASGLGYAIAEGFGAVGASLVLLDIDENNLKNAQKDFQAKGYPCEIYQVDISRLEDVRSVGEKIGRADVLVNSAGMNIRKPIIELSLEEYKRVLEVNLEGTFICCKVFGEMMVNQNKGSIINVASIHSHATMKEQSAYASTKGGVAQLSKVLALEFAESNVRVNALSPGFHHSALADQLMEDEEKYQALVDRIPMKKFAETNEIMGPAIFLATDASSYVTGISLVSDGGYLAQ